MNSYATEKRWIMLLSLLTQYLVPPNVERRINKQTVRSTLTNAFSKLTREVPAKKGTETAYRKWENRPQLIVQAAPGSDTASIAAYALVRKRSWLPRARTITGQLVVVIADR